MSKGNGQGKAGRPSKIGEAERQQVIAVVSVGGSIGDAAGIIGCSSRTVRDHMARCPDFRRGVKKAAKEGKLRLIQKVGDAPSWQAAAWMLERKWGREFGKQERVNLEHSGPNGKPIEVKHRVDYDAIESELRAIGGGRMAGRVSSDN